jgi:hypothetical protein
MTTCWKQDSVTLVHQPPGKVDDGRMTCPICGEVNDPAQRFCNQCGLLSARSARRGMISNVPLCGEPQAQERRCPDSARIGTASVAAAAGSQPLWQSGPVYLTGPYKGAPFGLSIVVPAKAGPFNLGNVVVRSTIAVDPHTAQVTVTSDALPQIRDGVPFRLKTVNVTLDRSDFVFNPTNCGQLRIVGAASGDMPDGSAGATAAISSPFAVAGCKNLPFKQKFSVLTQATHTRKFGAYLHVVVRSGAGQANIAGVRVLLPKQLPRDYRRSTRRARKSCSRPIRLDVRRPHGSGPPPSRRPSYRSL